MRGRSEKSKWKVPVIVVEQSSRRIFPQRGGGGGHGSRSFDFPGEKSLVEGRNGCSINAWLTQCSESRRGSTPRTCLVSQRKGWNSINVIPWNRQQHVKYSKPNNIFLERKSRSYKLLRSMWVNVLACAVILCHFYRSYLDLLLWKIDHERLRDNRDSFQNLSIQ